jgi:hypothetical protein
MPIQLQSNRPPQCCNLRSNDASQVRKTLRRRTLQYHKIYYTPAVEKQTRCFASKVRFLVKSVYFISMVKVGCDSHLQQKPEIPCK